MPPKKTITKPEPIEIPEPVVEETVDTEVEPAPQDDISTILAKIVAIGNMVKDLTVATKIFQKEYNKGVKSKVKSVKKVGGPRPPSGFAKPALLSKELCDFLGVAQGAEEARTWVTRKLNEYIKLNNLQNPENKKFIIPDAKLKALLKIDDSESLSYFNLQRYMKHLFVQPTPTA